MPRQDGVTPYDRKRGLERAKYEAPLCRQCIFADCMPHRFGCQVAIADRKKQQRPMPRLAVWRGEVYNRMSELAEASGARYDRLRYHSGLCETIAEAVVKAGGEEE